MIKFLISVFMIFFICSIASGQTPISKILKGKIIADYKDLEGIYIFNNKTQKSATTRNGGYFDIQACVGDTLLFSAISLKGLRIAISEKDFNKELYLVKMEVLIQNLREVMVMKYKNINAVALGIISKDVKSYSPAERKIKAASGLDLAGNNDGSTGVTFAVDPLLNWISGRTAMLKKELIVERNETFLDQIDQIFTDDIFLEKLKISLENIKGFKYYIIENLEFIKALRAKNKTMARFLMGELAAKYNQILNKEQQLQQNKNFEEKILDEKK